MGDVLACSGALRRLAVEVGKVASDLRLLSMGPRAGIAEIQLPAVQPGSSIMPGKVNPSVPEMVNQVCFQVFGCDATILAAADAGQLELNVMMPVIAWNALHATRILREAMRVLQERCVAGLRVDAGAMPGAARSQHRPRNRPQPLHRLRCDGGDRQGRRSARDDRSAISCASGGCLPDDQLDAMLSAEAMTSPGVPGSRAQTPYSEDRCSDTHWRRSLSRRQACAAARGSHSTDDCSIRRISGSLEGPDRDAWQRPDQIMDALRIDDGNVVADLGAGGGWFTVRLARRVGPNGIVYAEDIQHQMIESINRRVEREGLQKRVITKLGTAADPGLPQGALDAVLIVDAYHEMEQPVALLRNLAKSLKLDGRIGIVDFTADGGGPGPPVEERVDPQRVIKDAEEAGLRLTSRERFLRYQYMLVFETGNPETGAQLGSRER